MSRSATTLFHDHVDAFFVLLDYRQRPTGGLQQSRKFRFDKAALLFRIANVAEWRAHVESATQATLVQHIVAAQMHLGSFASRAQLLQVTIAEFALLVPLVTDRLSIGDALGHWRRGRRRGFRCGWTSF